MAWSKLIGTLNLSLDRKSQNPSLHLSWLLLFGLAACSPYNFSKEVADFSTGVDQLSGAFTDGFNALAVDRATTAQLELTKTRPKLALADACLDPEDLNNPCELHKSEPIQPKFAEIDMLRDKTMVALAVLRNYAHALAAVTNAADRAAYDAAVAQLSGSVGALAKTADPAAPGASIVAPAAVNAAGWLVGTALDQQRFESLKAGVIAASTARPGRSPPIEVIADRLGLGLAALSAERQAELISESHLLTNRLDRSLSDFDYRQGVSEAQTVVAMLDGLRRSDPKATTSALVEAHVALVAAVKDPRRNFESLVKAVGDFADKAAALQTALAAAAELEKASAK
jgi:hypothetical protein